MEELVSTKFFAGWGTLLMINVNLAQAKNRAGFGWGIVSLFLGPIATFILMFCEPLPS